MALPISASSLNTLIVLGYLCSLVAIGAYFGRKHQLNVDWYFTGLRRMPWLAVGMSMFASVTSTTPVLGLPGLAFDGNVAMVMVGLASPPVVPVLVFLFYRTYRAFSVSTSYEYIELRFGLPARYAVATLFCLARLGWLGVVLYSGSLVVAALTGFDIWLSVLFIAVFTTAYAAFGGLPVVIWTDVVQFAVMTSGIVLIAGTLLFSVPGGLGTIFRVVAEHDHVRGMNLHLNIHEMSALAVLLSFSLQFLQDYGVDHLSVQRLLATASVRSMAKAALVNSLADLLVVALLIFIGLGIFAHSQLHPAFASSGPSDTVLIRYAVQALPDGLSGLFLAAVLAAAMTSVDSGINAICHVALHDLIRPLRRNRQEEYLQAVRIGSCLVSLSAVAVASYVATTAQIVRASLSFLSLFGGPVLALFLLGILTKRAHFAGWLIGATTSMSVSLWLQHSGAVHFIYFFPAACLITLALGYLASCIWRGPDVDARLTVWGRPNESIRRACAEGMS
jgi:SSS family transporter